MFLDPLWTAKDWCYVRIPWVFFSPAIPGRPWAGKAGIEVTAIGLQ